MSQENSETRANHRSGRRWLVVLGIVLVLGGVAGLAVARNVVGGTFMGHCGHGGMARDFVAFRIERALDKVNATAEQKAKIRAILENAHAQHAARMAEHHKLHDQVVAALTADTIDRASLEGARKEAMVFVEQGSKQLVDVVVEAASVLTPEQRRQLAELAKESCK
jgi:Spy/CpxP family protein refolding chaperone